MLVRTAALAVGAMLALGLAVGEPVWAASPSPSPSPSSSTQSPASAGQQGRVTFGVGPANAQGGIDGRSGIQFAAPRGGTYHDQVLVVNQAPEALRLAIYTADVHNDANGKLQPDVAATKATDAGSWVTLTVPGGVHGEITVPAQSKLLVPLTIHVPKNAPVGDHMAGLMVSLTSVGASDGSTATKIKLEQRVGIRLAVRVAGQQSAQLTVTDMHVTYSGSVNPVARGVAHVIYTVRNTGTVRLAGTQTLSIHGLLGLATLTAHAPDVPLLLPGGAATFSVDVPDVTPAGLMTADVAITPQSALGDANPTAAPISGSAKFWAIDWTLLALILLLGLGVAWYLRSRRRPAPTAGRREKSGSSPELVGAGTSPGSES